MENFRSASYTVERLEQELQTKPANALVYLSVDVVTSPSQSQTVTVPCASLTWTHADDGDTVTLGQS